MDCLHQPVSSGVSVDHMLCRGYIVMLQTSEHPVGDLLCLDTAKSIVVYRNSKG